MKHEVDVPLVEHEEPVIASISRTLGRSAILANPSSPELGRQYENDALIPPEREISSFRQYARHQLELATRGLANPADVRIVRNAVMDNLRDMLHSAGQGDEQLSDLYPGYEAIRGASDLGV